MSQDTRKDPRAKVLTMTVRYKSATLDEFIEHHSYDVSRGGMFIKTPSPFPPGTLLKFEVKIAADQKVIQGVGRVVWKRDSEGGAGDTRPAGMGVKFIKIDDASRKVIDALVDSRGDASSAYEAGGGDGTATPAVAPAAAAPASVAKAPAPAPAAEAAKAPMQRKATMIGLGAINPSNRPATSTSTPSMPAADKPASSFFPDTKSEADMPPPEDRTVMKQAAELLQDALRETGSSMDEVASAPKYADPPAKQPELEAPPRTQRSEPPREQQAKEPVSARPAAVAQKSSVPRRAKSAVSEAPSQSACLRAPSRHRSRRSGGGGRVVVTRTIGGSLPLQAPSFTSTRAARLRRLPRSPERRRSSLRRLRRRSRAKRLPVPADTAASGCADEECCACGIGCTGRFCVRRSVCACRCRRRPASSMPAVVAQAATGGAEAQPSQKPKPVARPD